MRSPLDTLVRRSGAHMRNSACEVEQNTKPLEQRSTVYEPQVQALLSSLPIDIDAKGAQFVNI
jgi:hypothetical protein